MGKDTRPEMKKTIVGDFFEDLTTHLFGGETQDNGRNDYNIGAPDIINWERNQAYEVKATYRQDVHKIPAEQVEHYKELQKAEFPMENPEVYYFMWNYRDKKDFEILAHDKMKRPLAKSEKSLMVVSLDIIVAGVKVWPTSCFQGQTPYHRINSETRRKFRKEYANALVDIGLNPNDFSFRRFRLDERKYKRFNLPQFSITIIQNKNLRDVKLIQEERKNYSEPT